MAKKQELPKSINLLNPVNEPEDIWTKSYNWITQIGRYILVVIEIVVLGVFIARFLLDGRNNDLTEDINDTIVTLKHPSLRNYEQKFRLYQRYTDDIETLSEEQEINSKKISLVLDTVPDNITLKNISFQKNRVSLTLVAEEFENISDYTKKLNEDFEKVKVNLSKKGEKDSNDEDEGINLSITFNFKDTEN